MPNNSPSLVRKVASRDPRVARSTRQLGVALVELMLERQFNQITVEDILRRAGVGRSTFYAHYRNKQDVLYSSYEGMFRALEQCLDVPCYQGAVPQWRVVPVTEFCEHVSEQAALVGALQRAGQLDDMWKLASGFLAGMIERRIAPIAGTIPTMAPALASRMLAGAFLEMVEWWLSHQPAGSARRMDVAFHEIARASLQCASYEVRKV